MILTPEERRVFEQWCMEQARDNRALVVQGAKLGTRFPPVIKDKLEREADACEVVLDMLVRRTELSVPPGY